MPAITKSNIANIRSDVEAALKAIYAKHGVDVTVGRITYTASNFRCKIEGVVRAAVGSTATPADPRALALKSRARLIFGNAFKEGGIYNILGLGKGIVTGYNSRARAYPFVVKSVSTGKTYKVSSMIVKAAVAAGEVA